MIKNNIRSIIRTLMFRQPDQEPKAAVDATVMEEALQSFAISIVRTGGRLHGREEVRWHFRKLYASQRSDA